MASALVVGAGLAGLAAAHRLQSLGHRVTVLEARERPGGKHARATLSGVDYEPWPGVLPRSAPAFAELVGELGVADRVERTPLRAALALRDGALRPVPLEVRAALRGSLLAPLRLRRYALLAHWLGGALDPDEPSRETRLDDRSVADFCQVYLGRRARDALFAPLFAGAFGLDARDASRQLLFALADAQGNPALDALSGASALVEELVARVGGIETRARVEALEPDQRGVRLADGRALRADVVVLAVDAAESARLLGAVPPVTAAAFASLHAESGLALAVVTQKDVTVRERRIWIPAREGGELAALAVRAPRLVQLVARPDLARRHGQRGDEELAHLLLESGARALPELAHSVAASALHRFPGGRPAFAVGHFRALARIPALCAGDWTAAPHVEGELASGLRAARHADAALRAR